MNERPGVFLTALWLAVAVFWFVLAIGFVQWGGWLGLWAVFPGLGCIAMARSLYIGQRWKFLSYTSLLSGLLLIVIGVSNLNFLVAALFGLALCAASVFALRGFPRIPTSN